MIKQDTQLKIPSIAQLEQELLADSTTADMELPADITQDANKVLMAAQVRHDVSTFARCLINVYGGWPFLPDMERRRILVALKKIQDNAHDGMTAGELFEHLSPIIAKFRDNHISIRFNDKFVRTSFGKPVRDVGKNLSLPNGVLSEMRGDVAVIAFKTLRMQNHRAEFEEVERKMDDLLAESSALIVDLRGNGGGNSRPTDKLAYRLYGANVPSAKRAFIRVTPDAAIVHGRKMHPEWLEFPRGDAPVLLTEDIGTDIPLFEHNKAGYRKPIYVLIDGETGSGAEMFCTRMKPHPYVKFVGDNTAGCEVYGDVGRVCLPGSHILFVFGCVYRELEQKNFELNGYAPDIRVPTGGDAFQVAMQDLAVTHMNANSKGHDK